MIGVTYETKVQMKESFACRGVGHKPELQRLNLGYFAKGRADRTVNDIFHVDKFVHKK